MRFPVRYFGRFAELVVVVGRMWGGIGGIVGMVGVGGREDERELCVRSSRLKLRMRNSLLLLLLLLREVRMRVSDGVCLIY